MRLSEVLSGSDGLNKRFVYYLESQGYIRPAKIRKARISRRDYSAEDSRLVQEVWTYYRRGYSVQNAHDLATRTDRLSAYVLLPVPFRMWQRTLEILRRQDRAAEASAVYGESADVIARVVVPDESEVFSVLNQAFDEAAVAGVPVVLKLSRDPALGFARSSSPGAVDTSNTGFSEERGKMRAYVLIKVPAKQTGGVVEKLRDFPGVVEASVTYGETDVIAKLEVATQDDLDELILGRIQGIPSVESTRTFIVVGQMYWQR